MKKLVLLSIVLVFVNSCVTKDKNQEAKSELSMTEQSDSTLVWDTSYGGADKSYDTALLQLREEIAPKFDTFVFKDSVTGRTMNYNLYIPQNIDKTKKYPLVQFIADASTVGKGVKAPLMQGYGGIIWATEESQNENPCFVLVPSFEGPDWAVNDKWETSDEVAIAYRLFCHVVETYNIDTRKLYTTGQSMGGMISFYLNATHPDVFAASIFVGSQWDINVLQPLVEDTFFYIVSAGDEKASKGMAEVGTLLTKNNVKYGALELSAQLPIKEQNIKVDNLIKEGNKINFIDFTVGSVLPKSGQNKGGAEHMYSFDYAYKLKSVRDWLFKQEKN